MLNPENVRCFEIGCWELDLWAIESIYCVYLGWWQRRKRCSDFEIYSPNFWEVNELLQKSLFM